MHVQRIASATTLVNAVVGLFLDRGRLVDGPRHPVIRRFRMATRRFRGNLAGRVFDPSGRRSRRPDLGIGVDVDHPVLDQLWSPVYLWVRCEPDPGMRAAAA
jgi:hypothetical protein